MLIRHLRITVTVLGILAAAASASAAALGLDWKITSVSPVNGATFSEKSDVKIRCEWNAAIASGGTVDQPIEWDGMFSADGAVIHYFRVKYDTNGHWYIKPGTTGQNTFPWEEKPVYGTATNEFHGSAEMTWTAQGVGNHTVGCSIGHQSTPGSTSFESPAKLANNKMTVSIVVNPMGQLTPGRFPHPPEKKTTWTGGAPQQGVQPTVPKSTLAIAGAQAKHDPGCASLANLITVQVTIQNSNIPLAPGKGSVVVKENGGANLSSTFQLPAVGANEAKVVQLTIGAPASLVSALPGKHQFAISLSPVMTGGQPSFNKPADYPLTITLPSGYCGRR